MTSTQVDIKNLTLNFGVKGVVMRRFCDGVL